MEPEMKTEMKSEHAVATRSFRTIVTEEVRSHPFGYSVMGVGLLIGPVLITMIFPQVTVLQAIVGGLAFGVYGALCAVPQKFM
jgi:hypothetical protein